MLTLLVAMYLTQVVATSMSRPYKDTLLWPLFSVSQSGCSIQTQEAEGRDALRRIASGHGIRLGMDLSRETVQLARALTKGHLPRPVRVPAEMRLLV